MTSRIHRKTHLTEAEIARDEAIRAEFSDQPTLEQLIATGRCEEPIDQGSYMALVELGAALRRAREGQHLSSAELAKRTGIEAELLDRIEAGKAIGSPLSLLERVANSLSMRLRLVLDDGQAEVGTAR